MHSCGLRLVQLALDPIRTGAWRLDETRRSLADAGIQIASGMMATLGEDYTTIDSIRRTGGLRPDEHWEANLAAAGENARIARELSVSLVTFHAGFIPEDASDPLRATMVERIARVATAFAEQGVQVALETGQESATALRDVLAAPPLRDVGVNFDPANMILYGSGEPIPGLSRLANRVVQAHMKDALPSEIPGAWGQEVLAGSGRVDWKAFFEIVRERLPSIDVIIEREAGDSRVEDVCRGVEVATTFGARV
ncbi:MAG: sugar phosphate isomerase/epimerase family protein [Phycisphaerales bacterium]